MAKSPLDIILGLEDHASGPLRGVLGSLKGMATIGGGIIGAQIFSKIGSAIRGTATDALDAVANYERLGMSLEALVSQEMQMAHERAYGELLDINEFLEEASPRAKDLLHWIEQLAIKSPFDQEGVAIAFRTAMAYGFTSEQAQKLTQTSIDFAAATGGTSQQMNSIALALGQMQAKGKLAGQEILQLTNAGVNVRSILSGMGYDLDDVSKGLVKSDDFFNAFIETMETSFGGAAEKQSTTWAGLLNTLEDIKTIGLREFFGSTFEAIQPLVQTFADWIQDEGLERLKVAGDLIGNILGVLLDAGPMSIEFREALSAIIPQDVLDKIYSVVDAIMGFVNGSILPFVNEHGPAIRGALQALGIAFGVVVPVITLVGALLGILTSPITLIIAAIALLGAAWAENWGGIRDKAAAVWEFLEPILSDLWDWLEVNIPAAIETLRGFWEETLYPALERVWTFLTEDMAPIWEKLQELLEVAIPIALDILVGAWENVLAPALKTAYDWIKDKFIWIWEQLDAAIGGVEGAIKSVVGWIQTLIDKLKNAKLPKWATRQSPSEIELTFGNTAKALKAINSQLPSFRADIGAAGGGSFGGGIGGIEINVFPSPGMNEAQLAGRVGQRVYEAARQSRAAGINYAG